MVIALKRIAELENNLGEVKGQRETLSNQLSEIRLQTGKIQSNEENRTQENEISSYIVLINADYSYWFLLKILSTIKLHVKSTKRVKTLIPLPTAV